MTELDFNSKYEEGPGLKRGTEQRREGTLDQILEHYKKRKHKPDLGAANQETIASRYTEAFVQAGMLPLDERWLLDVGSFTGNWLVQACDQWGGKLENCWGVDLRPHIVERGREMYPGIQLVTASADKIPFRNEYFDIVHQSMMFSSVLDEKMRKAIAGEMWRVLKVGGYIAWYDFILNPFNPNARGMRKRDIRELFQYAEWVYCRRIGLAPPIVRLLNHIYEGLIPVLEKMVIFNTYYLCMLRKPK